MMSLSKRNEIINSYANVLMSIICEQNNINEAVENIKIFVKKTEFDKISVNPLNVVEYRSLLLKVQKNLQDSGKIGEFLLILFKRRYCFLINDILEKVEEKLANQLSFVNVVVISKEELNDNTKKYIHDMIKKDTDKELRIIYQFNKIFNDREIEIRMNGKVCNINENNVINSILKV